MRVTAHIPDDVARDAKIFADNEKKSVSSVIADALRHYVSERKKKDLGQRILNMAGKVHVSKDAHRDIERMREEADDRT